MYFAQIPNTHQPNLLLKDLKHAKRVQALLKQQSNAKNVAAL
jgi:hypothetical protein